MVLLPPVQMGDTKDVGPRDDQGRKHGTWRWVKPIHYRVDTTDPGYHTHMAMTVFYKHGIITRAFMKYDTTEKYTKAWEEGRAIGEPDDFFGGMPFKKGLWRGVKKDGSRHICMYNGKTVLWEYWQEGFHKTVLDPDGCFAYWATIKRVRPPPPKDEWPLEDWSPYLSDTGVEVIWTPPVDPW